MDVLMRIEQALETAMSRAEHPSAPPRLAAAMRHAVFPGGARVRPRLCLAVAQACGHDAPELADAAAVAIELLHCSSLVHDDLPCFDGADMRRGKPSVHAAFGEPLAVLAGDALIVHAYEVLAHEGVRWPSRLAGLVMLVSRSVGMPGGICAGQGWECEPQVDLASYHRAKTGSLFAAATMSGALASGHDPEPWRRLGLSIGEAFQVADDLKDKFCDASETGKPVGQDVTHHRPSACDLGVEGAAERLKSLMSDAIQSIPDCPGAGELRNLLLSESMRFVPKQIDRCAA